MKKMTPGKALKKTRILGVITHCPEAILFRRYQTFLSLPQMTLTSTETDDWSQLANRHTVI